MIYRVFRLGVMTPNVYAGCTFVARNVQIGDGLFVNRGCLFEGAGPLIIGRDCADRHGGNVPHVDTSVDR